MRKILGGFAGLGIVLGLLAVTPGEQRGLATPETIVMLNGSFKLLGILTVTDGGSVNNWTTQTRDAGGTLGDGGSGAAITSGQFDAGTGILAMIVCDGGMRTVNGKDSTTQATSYDVPVAGDEKFYTTLGSDENTIAVKPTSGASGSCAVYKGK